jgi:hypothetical protein
MKTNSKNDIIYQQICGLCKSLATKQKKPMAVPGSKITKLRMETSLKSQGPDYKLNWRLVAISANQMLEI